MTDLWATHNDGRGGIESCPTRHYRIAASANPLDPKPRAIRCREAGTITVEDDLGVSEDYIMTAGEVLTFRAHKVTAISGGSFTAWP